MWEELKTDDKITKYFPRYSKTRLPSKSYLMNVNEYLLNKIFDNEIKVIKRLCQNETIS